MKGEDENVTGESVPGRGNKYKVGEAAACSVGGERREETQEAEQRKERGEAPSATTASSQCRGKCSPWTTHVAERIPASALFILIRGS